MKLLEIKNLSVVINTRFGPLSALSDVSLTVNKGEVLGIVGESGAGKSLTGQAVLGLLEDPAAITAGEVLFEGVDLIKLSDKERQRVRGKKIGAVFQDPLTALNPLLTIGDQLVETISLHLGLGKKEAWDRAVQWLERVGIREANRRMTAYPHQLSGGMRQRVVISLALCGEPDLLIADEPTTALDVSVQAQILDLIKSLQSERNMGVILVTHDIGVIAQACSRIAVMYAGQVVESGPVGQILGNPAHPYTRGLIASVPRIDADVDRLVQIPGTMPRVGKRECGCQFAPRCTLARPVCSETMPATKQRAGRTLACIGEIP